MLTSPLNALIFELTSTLKLFTSFSIAFLLLQSASNLSWSVLYISSSAVSSLACSMSVLRLFTTLLVVELTGL